jgi:hypothetical protein
MYKVSRFLSGVLRLIVHLYVETVDSRKNQNAPVKPRLAELAKDNTKDHI